MKASPQPTETATPDHAKAKELVERIAASAALKKSHRLRELLEYLCAKALKGSGADLKEQVIGAEVFGRASDYDTGTDNIVRSSVFQLRKKLTQYFQREGAGEPILIVIPKGRYTLEFQPRQSAEGAMIRDQPPAGPATPRTTPRLRLVRWQYALLALVVCALPVAWKLADVRRNASPYVNFWRPLLAGPQDAYLVVADSGFGLLQDVTQQRLTLDDYLRLPTGRTGAAWKSPEYDSLIARLSGRAYTSVADAAVALRLGALNHRLGGHLTIRTVRSLSSRDFKLHNLVLLGSARSNPWCELLQAKLNFVLEYELNPARGVIRNRSPRAGEPQHYQATTGGTPGNAYGLVAYVPDFDGTGHVLTLAGTNMEGTEAAADFVLDEGRMNQFLNQLGAHGRERPLAFEALVRAYSVGGAPSTPELLAWRSAN